jgi:hypothetical protein
MAIVKWAILMTQHIKHCRLVSHAHGLSRAEGDHVVAVAVTGMGFTGLVGFGVRVGAVGLRAHKLDAGAAGEVHGEVVSADHRDVVVVVGAAAADGELGQRRGGLPGQLARHRPRAVSRLAVELAVRGGAPRAAPDPAGAGVGGDVECPRLARVQLLTAADGNRRWPYCVGALVYNGEGGRAGAGGQAGSD